MRVLFIGPLPQPVTGQSLACKVLLDHLQNQHTVDVINLSKPKFQGGVYSIGRILQIWLIVIKAFFLCRRADVIYLTISESVAGNLKDILIYVACLGRLNKMVVHLHGGAGMKRLVARGGFLSFVNKLFLSRIARVVVLGERLKTIYTGIVPTNKLVAVPNFSQDDFYVTQQDIDIKFSNLKPFRLLFLSNLLPGKGHEELLASLALLPQGVLSQIRLDFAGGFESDDDEHVFREKAQAVAQARVYVHGLVGGDKKRDLLANAHMFCLPTYYPYEGQPISILEAYASGCCVMTTDHSGIYDVFTPEVNGFAVKPKSPSAIAEVIDQAIANVGMLRRCAISNHEQARLKYRVSTHVKTLEDILSSVAA